MPAFRVSAYRQSIMQDGARWRRRNSTVMPRLIDSTDDGPATTMEDEQDQERYAWYWISDEREAYFPAAIISGDPASREPGATVTVRAYSKPEGAPGRAVPVSAIGPTIPWLGALREHADDLVQMDAVHEASILHCLRERYERDHIYTNVGDILVSINPFKQLDDFYSQEAVLEYRSFDERSKPPPHVFLIASAAFQQHVGSPRNPRRAQEIIIRSS